MPGLQLSIDVSPAQRAERKMQEYMRGIGRSARRAETKLDAVSRGLSTMDQKMSSMVRGLGTWQTALASAAGAAGLGYVINRTLKATQQLEKLSRQTGFNVKAIQQLQFAAQQTGVSANRLYDSLGELAQRMGEAAADGGEMAEGFKAAGIEIDGLSRRRPQRVLYQIADAIRDAKTQSQALNIAVKTFGDEGGRDMVAMLREGSGALRDMAERANELGLVLDKDVVRQSTEAKEKIDLLVDVLGTQFQRVIGELAPSISAIADDMGDWVENNQDFIDQDLPKYLQTIGSAAETAAREVGVLIEALSLPAQGAAWLGEKAAATAFGPIDTFERQVEKVEELQQKINKLTGGDAQLIGPQQENLERWRGQLEIAMTTLERMVEQQEMAAISGAKMYEQMAKNVEVTDNQNESTDAATKSLSTYAKEVVEAATSIEALAERNRELTTSYQDIALHGKEAVEQAQRTRDMAPPIVSSEEFERVEQDAKETADKVEDEFTNSADAIDRRYEQMLDNIQDEFATQIESMLDGNLRSWDDFFNSIFDMFKGTVAQMAAVDMTRAIFGQSAQGGAGLFTGPGGGGVVQNLMGGGGGFPGGGILRDLGLEGGGSGIMSTGIPGTQGLGSTTVPTGGSGMTGPPQAMASRGPITIGQGLSAAGGAYQIGTNISDFGDSASGTMGTVSGGLKVASAVPGPHQPFTAAGAAILDIANMSGIFGDGGDRPDVMMSPTGDLPYQSPDVSSDRFGWTTRSSGTSAHRPHLEEYLDSFFSGLDQSLRRDVDVAFEDVYERWTGTERRYRIAEPEDMREIANRFTRRIFEDVGGQLAAGAFEGSRESLASSKDFVQALRGEDQDFGSAWVETWSWLDNASQAVVDRLQSHVDELGNYEKAWEKLQGELQQVRGLVTPAIDQALSESIRQGDFSQFRSAFNESLDNQLRQGLMQAFKQQMVSDAVASAFGEVESWQDLMANVASGEITVSEFSDQLDRSNVNVDSLQENFDNLNEILEQLGITSQNTAENIQTFSEVQSRVFSSLANMPTSGVTSRTMQNWLTQRRFESAGWGDRWSQTTEFGVRQRWVDRFQSMMEDGFGEADYNTLRDLADQTDMTVNSFISTMERFSSQIADSERELANNVIEARSKYLDVLRKERSELKNTVDTMGQVIDSLGDFQSSLITGGQSPVNMGRRLAFSEREFERVGNRARAGNEEAMQNLQGVSQDYLSIARSAGMGGDAFREIQKALNATQTTAEEEKSTAEQQLDQLQAQLDRLDQIANSTLGMQEALENYQSALTSAVQSGYSDLESRFMGELTSLRQDQVEQAKSSGSSRDTSTMVRYASIKSDFDSGFMTPEQASNLDLSGNDLRRQIWERGAGVITDRWEEFASGGTISGPESGYRMPDATFHGTEHITPDSQMSDVKELLQEVRNELQMIRNTGGDQSARLKKIDRKLDESQRNIRPFYTEASS